MGFHINEWRLCALILWSLFSRWENSFTRIGEKSERTCHLAWSSLLTETSHIWGRWISFSDGKYNPISQSSSGSLFSRWENSSSLTDRKSERTCYLAWSSLPTETIHVWERWISFQVYNILWNQQKRIGWYVFEIHCLFWINFIIY